jgi:ABC-type lipoprotein export system ATPase subunit
MKPEKITDEEKCRVCIARACLMKPKVILAYEPTKGLETAEAENIIELIMQAAKDNEAILIVSSDDENIIKRADMEVDLSGEKK